MRGKDKPLYGLIGTSKLFDSVSEVLVDLSDEYGRSFDYAADCIAWPVKVWLYHRQDVEREVKDAAVESALAAVLEVLDREFGPAGNAITAVTRRMCDAAARLVSVVCKDYAPWTGEVVSRFVEVTREEARKMVEGAR